MGPTGRGSHCVKRLEKLLATCMTLQKSANRPSSKEEEHIFVERRDDLFNISQANVLELLKIDEDKQFLVNQRKSVI